MAFIEWAVEQDTDDCIEYPYSRNKYGYGYLHGRPTHRIACEMAHGSCPPGKETAHSCLTRACLNKRHLSWKTRPQNMQDKVRDNTHQRGERHPLSKLTEDQVREIKRRYAEGGCTHRSLAAEYGVSFWLIRQILVGNRWGWS